MTHTADLPCVRFRYVRVLACILAVIVIVMATRIGHMIPTMKQLTALCGYFVILLVAYLLSVEPEEVSVSPEQLIHLAWMKL